MRTQERNPWAPIFEERTQDETLKQERCARRDDWELAKDVYTLKKGVTRYALLSCRSLGNAGTLFNKTGRETYRDRLWSLYAKKEGLEFKRVRDSQEIWILHYSGDSQW